MYFLNETPKKGFVPLVGFLDPYIRHADSLELAVDHFDVIIHSKCQHDKLCDVSGFLNNST